MKNKNLPYLIIFSVIVILIAELIGFKVLSIGKFKIGLTTIIICSNYHYDFSI